MTTQPDPTIRERLRELAARHVHIVRSHPGLLGGINDPPSCKIDGQPWPCDARLLLVHLDTLERRVRAAEPWRDSLLAVIGACDTELDGGAANDFERGADAAYNWVLSVIDGDVLTEARSLISGTKEPTDG